jgi:hypothetical protein
LIDELDYQVQKIENEMDLKVESLIQQIHQHRDKYQEKLVKFKTDHKE